MFNKFRTYKIGIMALCVFFLGTSVAYPLPEVGEITSGAARISYPNSKTLAIEATENAIINYHSFNLEKGESLIITLPEASSEVLNRVLGEEASALLGKIECNGVFILVNESGIYLGASSDINAQGVILSTRDITNRNFLAKSHLFKRISKGELDKLLVNEGKVRIKEGGFGVLIAGAIDNKGLISAPLGKVALASGNAVKIKVSDDGLISVAIKEKVASTITDYKGAPITKKSTKRGGSVILNEDNLSSIFNKAINFEGVTPATAIQSKDGTIKIINGKEADASSNADKQDVEALNHKRHDPENAKSEEKQKKDGLIISYINNNGYRQYAKGAYAGMSQEDISDSLRSNLVQEGSDND